MSPSGGRSASVAALLGQAGHQAAQACVDQPPALLSRADPGHFTGGALHVEVQEQRACQRVRAAMSAFAGAFWSTMVRNEPVAFR